MKSKRVGHGLKWAVCSALLSASTLAAAAPREMSAASLARLESFTLSEADRHRGHTASADCIRVSRVSLAAAKSWCACAANRSPGPKEHVTREQVLAEQAAFIDRILAVAPSTEVSRLAAARAERRRAERRRRRSAALARDTAIARVVGVSNYSQDLLGNRAVHRRRHRARARRARPGCAHRRHRQRHRLHARRARRSGHAGRVRSGVGAASGRRRPAIPALTSGTGYLVIDDPGTTADDGLFPSAKVIGGYDFVGERWPNTPCRAATGSGSDRRAGCDHLRRSRHARRRHHRRQAGRRAGREAVRGQGLLRAGDVVQRRRADRRAWNSRVDPNGDGRIRDHVDIINMSLGSPYGQPFDDDLSARGGQRHQGRCADGGLRRQQRRQAVHHRLARRGIFGAERRADRGAFGARCS